MATQSFKVDNDKNSNEGSEHISNFAIGPPSEVSDFVLGDSTNGWAKW